MEIYDSVDSIFEKAIKGSHPNRSNDIIVLALHSSFLSEGFDCIKIKEDGFESDQSGLDALATHTNPSLPEGWNSTPDVYVMQYRQRSQKKLTCLVKVLPLGDILLINAICSDKLADVHTVSLPVNEYINSDNVQSTLSMSTLRNVIKLFFILNKDIIDKVKRNDTTVKFELKEKQEIKNFDHSIIESSSSEEEEKPSRRVNRRREPQRMTGEHTPISLIEPPRGGINPFGIGSNDLFPFGGVPGGGGMIMDPLRERGRFGPSIGPRPPGFHPPGARFDPVSPFEPRFHPGRGGMGQGRMNYGPDPDHLPPPGYDDMFS